MSTDIKTSWDLKLALEKIIAAIDQKASLFSEISAEEKHAVEAFAASLSLRRAKMRADLEAHAEAMERELCPVLERCDAIRRKVKDAAGVLTELPSEWEMRRVKELSSAIDSIAGIPSATWERVQAVIEISRAKQNDQHKTN